MVRRTRVWFDAHRAMPLIALLGLAAGCQHQQNGDAAAGDAALFAVESSFDEQLAAVQAGVANAIVLDEIPVFDAQAERLQGLDALEELSMMKANLSLTGFRAIGRLTSLKRLKLGNARPDDDAATELAKLSELEMLNLHASDLSDEGLNTLTRLQKLKLLRLGSSRVSDAGLKHLKSLPKLEFLFLQNARITDQGLDALRQLKTLDSLYLEGNDLSDEAVGKAFPTLHVHW